MKVALSNYFVIPVQVTSLRYVYRTRVPSEDSNQTALCAPDAFYIYIAKDEKKVFFLFCFFQADNEDFDQTARIRSLDLSLRRTYMSKSMFCHVVALIFNTLAINNQVS